ncbi:hypothetical protein IZU99_09950 [Oscillospiraceae bacterium CM]|nr:hypothetical protein IZU99_09950 [Oscillospiraceae bacterium CM]
MALTGGTTTIKEYGSFLELDLKKGPEYYDGVGVKRLNTARCGIGYVLRLLGLKKLLLPTYLCPKVREYLIAQSIELVNCALGDDLLPILPEKISGDTAVLIVNYFGLLPREKIETITSRFQNVIVDNAQAFYKKPAENAYSVYSPRKFFGVPDGCYVVGEKAGQEDFFIPCGFSADTSLFLLKRIERGCQGSYSDRMMNETRLDGSGLSLMSRLTRALLQNVDYITIKDRRVQNFRYAQSLFSQMNLFDLSRFPLDEDTVPMVYPLVLADDEILPHLLKSSVYLGRWWAALTSLVPENSLEMMLSRHLLPLPIDQRMTPEDLDCIYRLIVKRPVTPLI